MNIVERLFSSGEFMPHGLCYLWNPAMLRLQTSSDALIAAAYLTIPITLVYIVRKRKDVPIDWIFACFGIFIAACGATHAMEIWSVRNPTYWLSGCLKAVTAAASVTTAVLLMKLMPKILVTPSSNHLSKVNQSLEREIAERRRAEAELRENKARLAEAQELARLGSWDWDIAADNITWSDQMHCIFGMVPGTFAGTIDDFWSRIHPDDLSALRQTLEESHNTSTPFYCDYRIVRSDNTIRTVHARGIVVADEDMKPLRMFGTVQDITEQKQAEETLEKANAGLRDLSRFAGMAEVATNVLHNVGNVLNSVNVSASLVAESVKNSRASSLTKLAAVLREREHDLAAYFTNDPGGRQVPAYLSLLSEYLLEDQKATVKELASLRGNIEHIREIVAMQQSYAAFGGVKEMINIEELVEDSVRMNAGSLNRHQVEVVREFESVPPMNIEKHKILQILVNLLSNAKHACRASANPDPQVILRVANSGGGISISVTDNGVGIPPENLTRIFNHGFSTKTDGHGFGLHSGALAAQEMGGTLTAHSDGIGQGATFTLELPLTLDGRHPEPQRL